MSDFETITVQIPGPASDWDQATHSVRRYEAPTLLLRDRRVRNANLDRIFQRQEEELTHVLEGLADDTARALAKYLDPRNDQLMRTALLVERIEERLAGEAKREPTFVG